MVVGMLLDLFLIFFSNFSFDGGLEFAWSGDMFLAGICCWSMEMLKINVIKIGTYLHMFTRLLAMHNFLKFPISNSLFCLDKITDIRS